jgi:prepilin-type N-terminal cleavage/methylation domain-containing protein
MKGFTLIELMIVVLIAGILVAVGLPSFSDAITKNRVKRATEEIYGLVLQAKSESLVRDRNIHVNINTGSTPWCAGYALTASCDCTDATACVVPIAGTSVTQIVNGADYDNVTISETFSGTGTSFTLPRNRASAAGAIQVISGDWQLNINVNSMGYITICNPNTNTIPGYAEC